MSVKAIMYHYVRPDDPTFPNFKHLHIEDFSRQLDWFSENIGFADKESFLNAFKGGALPEGVVLTFDDGFMDHHDYVLPELKRRGLWGFFFMPTCVLEKGGMLDVHRVHMLLGRFPAEEIANRLKGIVKEYMIEKEALQEFSQTTYKFQKDNTEAFYVKRMFNYFLSPKYRKYVLDMLMKEFFSEEEIDLAARLYMGKEELRALLDAGMIVGSHSVSHPVMSRLKAKDQEHEIVESFATLEKTLGQVYPRTFCYPYGGKHTFTKTTERLLNKNGVVLAFAVYKSDITEEHIRTTPLALPRYDCNMFPYGQCRT